MIQRGEMTSNLMPQLKLKLDLAKMKIQSFGEHKETFQTKNHDNPIW